MYISSYTWEIVPEVAWAFYSYIESTHCYTIDRRTSSYIIIIVIVFGSRTEFYYSQVCWALTWKFVSSLLLNFVCIIEYVVGWSVEACGILLLCLIRLYSQSFHQGCFRHGSWIVYQLLFPLYLTHSSPNIRI